MPRRALSRAGTPFRAVWNARLIHPLRPDVVHVRGATEPAVAAITARAQPLLVTAWSSEILGAPNRRTARRALAGADAFTADSPLLFERCVELGTAREQGRLVGWGVDVGRFGPVPGGREGATTRLGLRDGPFVLSARAAGALYNIGKIVEAFDLLADEDPLVQLLLKHMHD
jgi:hypothetical protein